MKKYIDKINSLFDRAENRYPYIWNVMSAVLLIILVIMIMYPM